MEWLKKNYDQFALLCFAALLCVVAVFLIINARQFQEIFARISGQVQYNHNVQASDAAALETAKKEAQSPKIWNTYDASLFVSEGYILYRVNNVVRLMDPQNTPYVFHPPIPNNWFLDHHLDLLDQNALQDDPSEDGFSNLEKWKWGKDPTDPDSHPPYWTKLRLIRFIQIPFRLKFAAYDAGVFQINTIDLQQPSQFLSLGDQIAGTKFKILSFEKKIRTDDMGDHDNSELTVQNLETKVKVVLILGTVVDSPDSFALFRYYWKGTANVQVKKDKAFSLSPETDVQYKLIDIDATRALIQNVKTGETVKITSRTAEKVQ